MSFQGEIGANFKFEYDVPTGRYYSKGTPIPTFDMTKPKEQQTELIEPTQNLNRFANTFEDEANIINTDIPF